jgi:hypothetical protein
VGSVKNLEAAIRFFRFLGFSAIAGSLCARKLSWLTCTSEMAGLALPLLDPAARAASVPSTNTLMLHTAVSSRRLKEYRLVLTC